MFDKFNLLLHLTFGFCTQTYVSFINEKGFFIFEITLSLNENPRFEHRAELFFTKWEFTLFLRFWNMQI